MNIPILFEDEQLLVIDKPPGIVVNKSETSKSHTVQEWIEQTGKLVDPSGLELEEGKANQYNKTEEYIARSGIVHRLDKETSGILVIGKTLHAFQNLQDQFKARSTKKTYITLLHGNVEPEHGTINVPIARLPWNRMRFGVVPGGKESETEYQKDKILHVSGEVVSLITAYPHTGRTHQLRVHFAYIGHPIVGDSLYSGRKRSLILRQFTGRLMLHAWKLQLTHPLSHQELAFEASIPDDMKRIIGHGSQ